MKTMNKLKTYNVALVQTYSFEFSVEARNRAEAKKAAKEFYENYSDDNFFACSAASFEREVFKIISVEKNKVVTKK